MQNPPLTPDLLLQAYAAGVFPMAERRTDATLFWVDPRRRGILPLGGFHLSRSLARTIRSRRFRVSLNRDFAGVIDGCADRPDTWINVPIRTAFLDLHRRRYAHSIEVWEGAELAGGVYGLALGAGFFAESMFSRRRDASKVALAYLVDRLRQGGFALMDVQFLTPHLASLGAVEIPRERYHERLRAALSRPASMAVGPFPEPQLLLQRITQTS